MGVIVARAACGCVRAVVDDDPARRAQIGQQVARWRRVDGYRVERLAARPDDLRCAAHQL